jgi:putative heme-binding domain-containing protein
MRDPHPGVRKNAVRIAETRFEDAHVIGIRMAQMVNDPDPQVRLQVACSLGFCNVPELGAEPGKALGRLAVRDANDKYITAAVMSSVNAKNLDNVLLGALESPAPPPAVIDNLLRLANAFGNKTALAKLLDVVTTPVPQKGFEPWQYAALGGLLDALDRRNTSLAEMAKKDRELEAIVKHVEEVIGLARKKANDLKVAPADRAQVIRLLGRGVGEAAADRKLLSRLLVPQEPDLVQAAALEALGRQRDPAVPGLLLRGWKGYGPGLRSQVLDVLLRRPEGAKAVLDAVEHKQVLPFEVDAARRQRLLDSKAQDVRQRATKLFAAAASADRQKVIDSYKDVLSLKGDAARGQPLFTKHCAACHRLRGAGNDVGPDLSSLADKSSPTLLIAVLDPNRNVEARYINYVATTTNGLTYSGVLTNETGNSVTLVGQDGKAQVILRADLDELVSTGKSAMPEGLEKDLRPQDLADIFDYLRAAPPTLKEGPAR